MCIHWIDYVICVLVISLQTVTRPCWYMTEETGVFSAHSHLFTHNQHHSVAVHTGNILDGLEDLRSCSTLAGRGIQRGGNDELLPPILQTRGQDSEFRHRWYRGGAGPKRPSTHKFGDHDEINSLAGRELGRVRVYCDNRIMWNECEPNKRVSVIVRL